MSKIGVVVCCNSAIDYIDHPYDIEVIRSTIIFGEEKFLDYVELTADEFYRRIDENPDVIPKTSMASTGEVAEIFEKYQNNGYDELICITISSNMSGTYQNCILASELVDIKVNVFDSKSVGYIESYMALESSRLVEEGKSVSEIIEFLEYTRDNSKLIFTVPDLRFLVRNGRLSNASGFVGNMMKIKPLLEISKDGKVVTIEKIRTLRKAIDQIIELVLDETKNIEGEYVLIHANNPDQCENIRELLKVKGINNVLDYPLTPVVGCHGGPGAICLGFIPKYKD